MILKGVFVRQLQPGDLLIGLARRVVAIQVERHRRRITFADAHSGAVSVASLCANTRFDIERADSAPPSV